jgi:hypothetical protein
LRAVARERRYAHRVVHYSKTHRWMAKRVSRTAFGPLVGLSALALGATLLKACLNSRNVPIGDVRRRLVDHVVGATRNGQWDCDAKRCCGLEVDEQFNFSSLLDR